MKTKIMMAVLCGIVLSFITIMSAYASWEEYTISATGQDPSGSGLSVAWSQTDGSGKSQIYLSQYNSSTMTWNTGAITNNTSYDSTLPSLNIVGGAPAVAYVRNNNIYYWNGTEQQVTTNGYYNTAPLVTSNGAIVWSGRYSTGSPGQYEIYSYAGSTLRETTNTYQDNAPGAGDTQIVYSGKGGSGTTTDYEIWKTQLGPGGSSVTQITTNTTDDTNPSAWGDFVAWQAVSGSVSQIYVSGIANPSATQLTSNLNNSNTNPTVPIVGSVAWQRTDDNNKQQILYYSSSTETQLTIGSTDHLNPSATIDTLYNSNSSIDIYYQNGTGGGIKLLRDAPLGSVQEVPPTGPIGDGGSGEQQANDIRLDPSNGWWNVGGHLTMAGQLNQIEATNQGRAYNNYSLDVYLDYLNNPSTFILSNALGNSETFLVASVETSANQYPEPGQNAVWKINFTSETSSNSLSTPAWLVGSLYVTLTQGGPDPNARLETSDLQVVWNDFKRAPATLTEGPSLSWALSNSTILSSGSGDELSWEIREITDPAWEGLKYFKYIYKNSGTFDKNLVINEFGSSESTMYFPGSTVYTIGWDGNKYVVANSSTISGVAMSMSGGEGKTYGGTTEGVFSLSYPIYSGGAYGPATYYDYPASNNSGDIEWLDNPGNPVPEPVTLISLLFSLSGAAVIKMRKRASNRA